MTRVRPAGPVALALLLGGCGPAAAPDPQPAPTADAPMAGAGVPEAESRAGPALALDAEGLRFVDVDSGRSSLLTFGAAREQVEDAVQRAAGGSAERSNGEECPAGPTQFSRFGALQLAFQDDRWIGWALNGPASVITIDGIGIGTTRQAVEESRQITPVPDSTLGEEFVLGSADQETAISGIFDAPGADGRVEYLWGGTACNFR